MIRGLWSSPAGGERLFDGPCSLFAPTDSSTPASLPISQAAVGADWVHEVKHDGYRLIMRRGGEAVAAGRTGRIGLANQWERFCLQL
jgi:ATP-dependent DNA ligase